jgi:hypothetical protein
MSINLLDDLAEDLDSLEREKLISIFLPTLAYLT